MVQSTAASGDTQANSNLLSPTGAPYDPLELQRAFAGMSARDVYTLLCKRNGCKAVSSIISLLPEKPGDWSSLTELDLGLTYVGPRGVVPLLELCKCMSQLTSLNLSSNYLNNQSIWHICKVLTFHPTLNRLELSQNDISWTAGMCVLELVTRNSNITKVGLSDTLVMPKVVQSIQTQIRKNLVAGSRHNRRGPNPSNHPVTIRLRSLKRFFREALSKDENATQDGRLPKSILVDGMREAYKLTGKEAELDSKSPAYFDRYLARAGNLGDTVDWEAFMLLVMLEDITVNLEAIGQLRAAFNAYDVDDGGYIEYCDLKDAMALLRDGAEPTPEEVLSKMEAYDADDMMTLNWDEFLLLMYDKGPIVGELSSFHVYTPMRQRKPAHF